METNNQDARTALLQYMSGKVPLAERDEFDRRLLEDEMFSRQVEETEFSLLEAYANGDLSTEEKAIVGSWIAASPRRKLEGRVTEALRRTSTVTDRSRRWVAVVLWAIPVAACLALLLVHFGFRHSSKAPILVAGTPPASTTLATEAFASDTILLDAKRLRGADRQVPTTYSLHANLPTRIQVLIPKLAPGKHYTADLRRKLSTLSSPPIHMLESQVMDPMNQPYLEFQLPAASLPQGAYELVVRSSAGAYRLHFIVAYVGH